MVPQPRATQRLPLMQHASQLQPSSAAPPGHGAASCAAPASACATPAAPRRGPMEASSCVVRWPRSTAACALSQAHAADSAAVSGSNAPASMARSSSALRSARAFTSPPPSGSGGSSVLHSACVRAWRRLRAWRGRRAAPRPTRPRRLNPPARRVRRRCPTRSQEPTPPRKRQPRRLRRHAGGAPGSAPPRLHPGAS